jgi:ribulose kinase
MPRFLNTALLGAALIASIAMPTTALRAADQKSARSYHDAQHNDDHQWNRNEDQAYRVYVKQNHRRNTTFVKLKDNDQQAYWGWRHEHSDAVLRINIR